MNGKFGKLRGGTAGNELRADGFPGCTVNKPYNELLIIVNREIDPVAVVFEFNIEYIGFPASNSKSSSLPRQLPSLLAIQMRSPGVGFVMHQS